MDGVLAASILAFQQQSLMDQIALEYSLENTTQIDALIKQGLNDNSDTISSNKCFNRIRQNLMAKCLKFTTNVPPYLENGSGHILW
jgi:hypothetical protein